MKSNQKVRFPVPNRLPWVLYLPSSESRESGNKNRIFTSKPFEHGGREREGRKDAAT